MSEYLSEEGLEKLKTELHHLKTAKRQEIAARLEHAKTIGDLSGRQRPGTKHLQDVAPCLVGKRAKDSTRRGSRHMSD